MLGSSCGVSDLNAIAYANKLCNDYGLDTIGTGATIAWAMGCFERGILTAEELGYPLPFGDGAAMVHTLELMASRTGFGNVLADGSSRAAARLGKGQGCLTTVKGGELPGHMPQANASLGVIYAVSPFGPDHQSSEYDFRIEGGAQELWLRRLKLLGFDHSLTPGSLDEEKVRFALQTQYFYSFLDSADLCQFVFGPAWSLYGPEETIEVVQAVTGWQDFDLAELLAIGARRLNMMRLVNQRLGLDRASDRLPDKLFRPAQGTGPTAGTAVSQARLASAIETYYRLAGWDVRTGNPTVQRLTELGLDWAAP
jgi:aldehyde:ferredoxin oxidoreductase